MKKWLSLSLFFSALLCCKVQAQFSISLLAGVNASKVVMTDAPELPPGIEGYNDMSEPRLGFQAGAQVSYLENRFGIVSGLIYEQKGNKIPFQSLSGASNEAVYRYNYLSMPLLGRYNITDVIYLGAGFSTSYLLNASYANDDIDEIYLIQTLGGNNLGVEFNRIQINLLSEIGVSITPQVGLNIRYLHGIQNIYDNPITYTDENGEPLNDENSKFYNRSLQLNLTYTLVQ
jgi:hypothetical protein